MIRVKIEQHNLYFTIKVYDNYLTNAINGLKLKLTTFKWKYNKKYKRLVRELDTTYYCYDPLLDVYRLPISCIKLCMWYLGSEGVNRDQIEFVDNRKLVNSKPLGYKFQAPFKFRDEQIKYLDAINANLNKKILLIDAQPGFGKTALLAYMFAHLNMRTALFLLPKYISKWIEDFKFYYKIKRDDIYVVQGADSLLKLLSTPSKDLKYSIYIFSLNTIDVYIKGYESGDLSYPVPPYQLMQHIQAGILANDETHNVFRQVSSVILYSDVNVMLCASASFDSNQKSIKELYKTFIPLENRISNLAKLKKYTNVLAITYEMQILKRIKFRRAQGYNHILYEESILKYKSVTKDYFKMILSYINKMYLQKRKDKTEKIAIFFASLAMCDKFNKFLNNHLPNEKIYMYVGGKEYIEMLNANIIISNQQMLGTGIDLKGLITVLQTVSVSSLQANIQNFGRLREIKDREVYYCYFYNIYIPNQKMMAKDRYEAIKDKIKTYRGEHYPIRF